MLSFDKAYDVVVAGGGVAGVAAALEAARQGMRTALIEKTVWPGGLATTGLVNIYLPLCNGRGRQVTFGIAEDLFWRSIQYGPGGIQGDWRSGSGPRFRTLFAPGSFILALDEMLTEAGVDIWYDTLICLPIMEGSRCAGVEVENKSGRGALRATVTIDATGDADVAHRSGASCMEGVNNLSVWTLEASLDKLRQAAESDQLTPLLHTARYGGWRNPDAVDDEQNTFHGIDGKMVSDYMIRGRQLVLDAFKQRAEANLSEREHWFPACLPAMAQLRRTRRIVGRSTLEPADMGRHRDDAIGLLPDWRKAGPVYELPFGALLPDNVSHLLAAGRCVSADGDAWEITRVIPPAALSGQVAGAAAALAIRQNVAPANLEVGDLQTFLREERGFTLHIEELGLTADDLKT